jgi:SAM-dependent methyltransferase
VSQSTPLDPARGAAVYNPRTLRLYDFWVHGLSNPLAWRCPTSELLRLYERNASSRHLDVGVGTGYLLDRCRWPTAAPRIVLLDLNTDSLRFTSERIRRYAPVAHHANVLEPVTVPEAPFDSVALTYLLHCLPGDFTSKSAVFRHLGPLLSPEGVLFGATILGRDVERGLLARTLMSAYNRRGIFGNRHDSPARLRAALAEYFEQVDVRQVGAVALFEARRYRAPRA